jgi:3-deoxy-manno-octulosonate cytidylyltransferase (CMP-KDO synthetase)
MKIVGVIPARWHSTRFPGKILADINGRPMLQRVWQQAQKARMLSSVIVACDAAHVLEQVRLFGATGVMTRADHVSGSDRVAEAVHDSDAQGVVNIQADEPLIDPSLIDALCRALIASPGFEVVTAVKRISTKEEFYSPNVVKAVVSTQGEALYFSRSAIPFRRDGEPQDYTHYLKHLGIYAYRRKFLLQYCRWPKSFLEQEESLEQLRILEAGYRIKTVLTESESIGVDTPEDLVKVNGHIRLGGLA